MNLCESNSLTKVRILGRTIFKTELPIKIGIMSKSTIFFPLRSNVEWFGPARVYPLEQRIKESMLLYDYLEFEGGAYTCIVTKKGSFDFHIPESKISTEDRRFLLRGMGRKMELMMMNKSGKRIPIFRGEIEKYFHADFNSVLQNMECKDLDFVKLKEIGLTQSGKQILRKISTADKRDSNVMSIVKGSLFLKRKIVDGVNHSLMLSGALKVPILVDNLHEEVLKYKLHQTIEKISVNKKVEVLDSILQLTFPDFSSLDIDNLVELRKDRAIKKFCEKIRDINDRISDASDPVKFREEAQHLFVRDLLKEIKELAPSKKSIIIDAVGGSIPYVGTALGIAKNLYNKYDYSRSWLSFLMKLA